MWPGETVFVVGGGPSLRGFDAACLVGRHVVAVNNAWELVPAAQVVHFADAIWHRWNGERLANFTGRYVTTVARQLADDPRVCVLEKTGREGIEFDPAKLRGHNSGHQALNLAVHFGAARIVLLGFDMKTAADGSFQYHAEHRRPSVAHDYELRMIPEMRTTVAPLAEHGIEVLNATPGSALDCFPCIELVSVLCRAPSF